MSNTIPDQVANLHKQYPEIWDAFTHLAATCHDRGGPLDERSRKLAKLAIAIGHRHEGAVHSAVRHALAGGLSREELVHVALLAITTIGWPAARAAITWIDDVAASDVTVAGQEPD
jgi:alkylhydroperoxidase/carboxymuconolactone decarboxylase family protein YurZ